MPRPDQARPVEVRFWENVDSSLGPDACWPWKGYRRTTPKFDYGMLTIGSRVDRSVRSVAAHRLSYQLAYGDIPEGMHVCHHCDNPPCVNPRHLFLGDDAANMADRNRKGRTSRAPRNRGTGNHFAKLTADDVLQVRERLAGGETGRSVAREFGVSPALVSRIRLGLSWGWLDAGEPLQGAQKGAPE